MITLNLSIHKSVLTFSDNDRKNCISDIDNYFVNDAWCKEAPPYQTWPVLFNRTESHWVRLKEQITKQILINYNLNNFSCLAWAYVCFSGKSQNSNVYSGWHAHSKYNSLYSAIFYLNFDSSFDATEFMDSNGDVYRPKLEQNTLLCFDSKIVHRPPIWNENNKQNRYVIGVDYKVQT